VAPKCIQKHQKSIFSTLVSTLKTKKVEVWVEVAIPVTIITGTAS
jgi:hypothetical protein